VLSLLRIFFVFQAVSVIVLFVRCTAIDPTDKTSAKKKRKDKSKGVLMKLRVKVVLSQVVVRFFRRLERKILRNFLRRTYLDPWKSSVQLEPLLPFPLVMKDDDSVTPDPKEEDDISYCSLCDLEVCFLFFTSIYISNHFSLKARTYLDVSLCVLLRLNAAVSIAGHVTGVSKGLITIVG